MKNSAVVIEGKENVDKARILALRSALKLEVIGMKRKGRSAYAIVKSELGLKGNKKEVLAQLDKYVDEHIFGLKIPNGYDRAPEADGRCQECEGENGSHTRDCALVN
jgi:hypothetical protein